MKHLLYYLVITFLLMLFPTSSANSQNLIIDQQETLNKVGNLDSIAAYNARLAISLNDKIIATPQITMVAGKAEIIANAATTTNPYKIQITLLDKEKIREKFPQLSLQTSITETVFIEVGVFLPTSLDEPVKHWKKIAAPAGLIQTNGQLLRITTDISSSSLNMAPIGQPITRLGLDVSVFPVSITQQQIDARKSRCDSQLRSKNSDTVSKALSGHDIVITQCCSDGCISCCWGGTLCCSDETQCPGGGCCI
ncbi:MAG: hypothetical protein JKY46_01615 [Robiginitomaculum sp.]|nr:hypothetical protein [Robiginitomaculum sp.]